MINKAQMEKEITFTEIKGIFMKDHETFGKMDPYLIFNIGKSQGKTETAQDAGKEPEWKQQIKLTYFDQTIIMVKSYEEDTTSDDLLGTGQIQIKSLSNSGLLEFKIEHQGEKIATITAKYSLKTLQPAPLLIIKQIQCNFYKETKFLLSTKPYLEVTCQDQNNVTQKRQEQITRTISWNQSLRIRIINEKSIKFNLLDNNQNNAKIFSYETSTTQFRTKNGTKSFNVNDKNFEPLGILEFQYETLNFVSQEQSKKNIDKKKKTENQLTEIKITKITGDLKQDSNDIYMKILVGPNMIQTNEIQNAKRNFINDNTYSFYAQPKQNKMIFVLYDKDIIKDDVLGMGYLSLNNEISSTQRIQIKSQGQQSIGSILLNLNVKKVQAKSILLNNIKLELKQDHDIIGSSQPYIICRIGGWSARTETAEGRLIYFKKSLNLKFSSENYLTFEIWDQDVNSDDKIFQEQVSLSQIKQIKGEKTIVLKNKDSEKNGSLTFKYETINVYEDKKNTIKEKQKSKQTQKNSKSKSKIESIQTERVRIQDKKEDYFQKEENQLVKNNNQSVDHQNKSGQLNSSKSGHFQLPKIEASHNFGDKIYAKQSVATLQKSILVYSMPKASRFGSGPKYGGQPSYYVDSCFNKNSGRGVGFGFGNKKQFPQWMERNMKENPPPSAYFSGKQSQQFRQKGPTFGLSYKYYEKVTIPKEKTNLLQSKTRLKPLK